MFYVQKHSPVHHDRSPCANDNNVRLRSFGIVRIDTSLYGSIPTHRAIMPHHLIDSALRNHISKFAPKIKKRQWSSMHPSPLI